MSSSGDNRSEHLFPLYRDVMRVVMEFLNLRELHVAVQVCRHWYNIIQQTKPSTCLRSIYNDKLVSRLLSSSSSSPPSLLETYVNRIQCIREPSVPLSLLTTQIQRRFPNLRDLTLRVDTNSQCSATQGPDEEFRDQFTLPSSLERIYTNVGFERLSFLLSATSRLSNLTSLSIGIPYHTHLRRNELLDISPSQSEFLAFLHTDFTQLQSLRQLTWLCLAVAPGRSNLRRAELESAQIHEIIPASIIPLVRALPALVNFALTYPGLSLTRWMPEFIRALAQQPNSNQLKLQSISYQGHATQSIVEALSSIPSITSFSGVVDLPVDKYDLLATFPHLTHFQFSEGLYAGMKHQMTVDGAILAAKQCSNVEHLLMLFWPSIQSSQLTTLLSPLTRLNILQLEGCPNLEDLSFLLHHGLPRRLSELVVKGCDRIRAKECEVLFQMQELVQLFFETNVDLPEDLRQQLTFGSSTCKLPQASNRNAQSLIASKNAGDIRSSQ